MTVSILQQLSGRVIPQFFLGFFFHFIYLFFLLIIIKKGRREGGKTFLVFFLKTYLSVGFYLLS